MTNNSPPIGGKKYFDVARPGKTPAPPSSRPVIINDKQQVQDPAVALGGVGEAIKLMDSKQKAAVGSAALAQTETTTQTETPAPEAASPKPAPPADDPVAADDVPAAPEEADQSTPEPSPEVVVSHHGAYNTYSRVLKKILSVLAIVFLLAFIFNLLLDINAVHIDGVPHTNFFDY